MSLFGEISFKKLDTYDFNCWLSYHPTLICEGLNLAIYFWIIRLMKSFDPNFVSFSEN